LPDLSSKNKKSANASPEAKFNKRVKSLARASPIKKRLLIKDYINKMLERRDRKIVWEEPGVAPYEKPNAQSR
jgi:hypothetical protein